MSGLDLPVVPVTPSVPVRSTATIERGEEAAMIRKVRRLSPCGGGWRRCSRHSPTAADGPRRAEAAARRGGHHRRRAAEPLRLRAETDPPTSSR